MISLVVILYLAATCLAQYNPNNNNNHAPVHYVNIGAQLQGDYKFGYDTGNDGSFREETRNPDGSVSGAYGYIDASGKKKIIRYTAGKDGFKAEGDDIPKAPPAPQTPQPQYNYQQPQPQPQYNSYQQPQPQPQYNYQQPQYNSYQQPQPQMQYNSYQQPQPSHGYSQQSGSYNPFAYHNPAPGQHVNNVDNQLSYNIGAGQSNRYQG